MTHLDSRTQIARPLLLLIAVLAFSSRTAAEPSPAYDEAWQRLKSLAGDWERHRADGGAEVVRYHVTGGEKVVWEEFLGRTPDGVRSMATAYHLDGDDIRATHYCGAGNQPRLRAATWDPERQVLRFDFVDVTNLKASDAYYTTGIELQFEGDDRVELRFQGTEAGQLGEWQTHSLRRLTTRASRGEQDS